MSVADPLDDKSSSTGPVIAGFLMVVVAIGVAAWGISVRNKSLAVVTKETREAAVPAVAVVKPERGAPQEEIVLPGTMQPFMDAPIYARTNGYLRRRLVDIGSKVKAGQTLAEIDTPELDQQLQQARADIATAEANAKLAQTTADRYRDLIKTDSVSQQDVDNATGNLEARVAAVESARANLRRLEQLQSFRRIEAPFAGVITVRNVDVGALIDPGGNAKELFHIADTRRLRVFVNVPEAYSRTSRTATSVDLTLREFPGRRFTGKIARTSEAIEVASRTLLTEIDVDNAKGELLPGSYTEVHFKLPTETTTYKLPVNTLLFRAEGLRVAVVRAGQKVELLPITLGRDFGATVEVLSGIDGSESVVANPPDSLETGHVVQVVAAKKEAASPAGASAPPAAAPAPASPAPAAKEGGAK